jgi:hypothetical protein
MLTMPLNLCTAFGTGSEQHIAEKISGVGAMIPGVVVETLCGRRILDYGAQLSSDPSRWPSGPTICPQCRDIATHR